MNNIKEQFLGFYNTPSLFEDLNSLKQFSIPDIDLDNLNIENINIKGKLPLGKRIEYFFEHCINLSSRYDLLAKNIQIIKNKNTLGEIDFILFDNNENCFKHVEVVYKYYLYDMSFENELDRYIGPNRNDTLVKKLQKLKDKQLPLLFENSTKEHLPQIDFNNIKQEVCFKGNIYLPFYQKDLNLMFQDSVKGYFLSYNEFITDEYFKTCKFKIPHRYDWVNFILSEIISVSYHEAVKLIEYFLKYEKSPLVCIEKEEKYIPLFITWW